MTVRRHTWHVITEYVTEIDTCQVCVWREREGGGRGDEGLRERGGQGTERERKGRDGEREGGRDGEGGKDGERESYLPAFLS